MGGQRAIVLPAVALFMTVVGVAAAYALRVTACGSTQPKPPEASRRMREALGEFEQLVLLAILQLDGDVYAARIVEEIERRTGRSTAPATVYITLRRLEEKGLVESWMSESAQERGGKSRRCVTVTKPGVKDFARPARRTIRCGKGWSFPGKAAVDARAAMILTPIFAVNWISSWSAHLLEQYANNRLIRPRAE